MLRKVEFIISPQRLDDLRDLLYHKGIDGMTIIDASGFGVHSRKDGNGKPIIEKRTKVEIVVDENVVDDVIRELKRYIVSRKLGFGKIFVIPVEDAVRVSTREFGVKAV